MHITIIDYDETYLSLMLGKGESNVSIPLIYYLRGVEPNDFSIFVVVYNYLTYITPLLITSFSLFFNQTSLDI